MEDTRNDLGDDLYLRDDYLRDDCLLNNVAQHIAKVEGNESCKVVLLQDEISSR